MTSASENVWTTQPLTGPFEATVELPGSKSLTNRALVMASLAAGPCTLEGVLFADDTRHMLANLERLGLKLEVDEPARRVRVDPVASTGFAFENVELFCGNSGTTLRFLAALLAAVGEADFTLTGEPRMLERPAGPLAELLNRMGGDVGFPGREGYPPLLVRGRELAGGTINYPSGTTLSSQYLSAALMVAPYTRQETRIDLAGDQTSWPYVKMTMRLMDLFGITPEVELDPETEAPVALIVPRGRYKPTDYAIEPDASAASYFLGLAAIHPGSRVTVRRLGNHSLQGDAAFAGVLRRMGCEVEQSADETIIVGPTSLSGVEVDMTDMPDCAQTLAVVALFATEETTMRGLHTLRVKETDRVAALQNELTKLGADVSVTGEGRELSMTITPPRRLRPASIATYDDHRMAMSFALAATKRRGIEIENPKCVSKTFPEFFEVLGRTVNGEEAY